MLLRLVASVLSPGCCGQQQQRRNPPVRSCSGRRLQIGGLHVGRAGPSVVRTSAVLVKLSAMDAHDVAADLCARPQHHTDTAVAAAEAGAFHAAVASFRLALQLDPSDAVLHEQLAQCLMELEQHEAALRAAETATALQPDWCDAWVTLGRACLNTGRPQAAAKAFDRSLALQPGQVEVQAELQQAAELAQQAVARQVGLPGLAISTNPASASGPGCVIWEAGIQLARLLVTCSHSTAAHHHQHDHHQQQHQQHDITAACTAAFVPPDAAASVILGKRQQCSVWQHLSGAQVLEVGSGTGIIGITAAALGAHVTLTDLPEMQQLLAANIAANAGLVSAARGSAAAAVLDWGDLVDSNSSSSSSTDQGHHHLDPGTSSSVAVLRQLGSWDWAMGADLVYNAGQVEPVVRLIAAVLAARTSSGSSGLAGSNNSSSDGGTRCAGFLLAHKQRHQQVDQQLQDALHLAGLHVAVVAQQQQQQQQQQQGHSCHQYGQQPGPKQQQDATPAATSQQAQDTAQLPEHSAGGVVVWWITAAGDRDAVAGGAEQQAVAHGLAQQQTCEQPQHLKECKSLSQQQHGHLQQPAAATQQSGDASEQEQQLQQPWPTEPSWGQQQRALDFQGDRFDLQRLRPSAAPKQDTQQQEQQQQLPQKLLLLSAGLAGVGKSTVLRLLSDRLGNGCVYLDKDTINQALLGGQPYFSEYYKQHVQQQTYAVMFGIAADNLAARQQCVVLLDGQFGYKLTAEYVQPYLQAIRRGETLHLGHHPVERSADSHEEQQQQQQQQGRQEVAGLQEFNAQQQPCLWPEGVSSTKGCLVVLLLFDTGGCSDLQLQRLQARGLARDDGKYAAFEQYRVQEMQTLQRQLQQATAAGLLDGVLDVDTSQSSAVCVEDIIRQLALLQGKLRP